MQYQAYLSRGRLEPGAALMIGGNRPATEDTVAIALTGKKQQLSAVVAAFGLGRLVLSVNKLKVEVQPWLSGHDAAPYGPTGPASKWTIKAVHGVVR